MTINDIRNEGFPCINIISLVAEIATVPSLPGEFQAALANDQAAHS
jgi:hypothetical protein